MASDPSLLRISEQIGRVLDAQERALEDRRETRASLDRINDRVNAMSQSFEALKLEMGPVKLLSKDYERLKPRATLVILMLVALSIGAGGGGGALFSEAVKFLK